MSNTNEPIDAEIVQSQPLQRISEVEHAIAEAEKLGKALDKLRAMFIARTVPGDWIKMGDTVYLEGDGALRIAPLAGVRFDRVRKIEETKESGAIEVTYRADFHSQLFNTTFSDVERSRAQDDSFLMKKDGSFADLADVRSAAYKGMIARGVSLCTGLTGLKPEEMKDRFGFDVSTGASVEYKSAKADAKKADQKAASDGQKEVARLLYKVFTGNDKESADWLEMATEKKGPGGWAGKRDVSKLTDANVRWILPKLKQMEEAFDKEIAESEGGGE